VSNLEPLCASPLYSAKRPQNLQDAIKQANSRFGIEITLTMIRMCLWVDLYSDQWREHLRDLLEMVSSYNNPQDKQRIILALRSLASIFLAMMPRAENMAVVFLEGRDAASLNEIEFLALNEAISVTGWMYVRAQEFQHATPHLIKRSGFFIDKAVQGILLVNDRRYIGKRNDPEAEFIEGFIQDILSFRREVKEAVQPVDKGQGGSPLAQHKAGSPVSANSLDSTQEQGLGEFLKKIVESR